MGRKDSTMKNTVKTRWNITESKALNAICKSMEEAMDQTGLTVEELMENVESMAWFEGLTVLEELEALSIL